MVVVWPSFRIGEASAHPNSEASTRTSDEASNGMTAHPVGRVESAQKEHGPDGPGSGCARDDEVQDDQSRWATCLSFPDHKRCTPADTSGFSRGCKTRRRNAGPSSRYGPAGRE